MYYHIYKIVSVNKYIVMVTIYDKVVINDLVSINWVFNEEKMKLLMDKVSWQPDLSLFEGPRYHRIVKALSAAIEKGHLKKGDRLPTHRELAEQLKVTVGTVTRAYLLAEKLGITEAVVGKGTFIASVHTLPDTNIEANYPWLANINQPNFIDLSVNQAPLGPQADLLHQGMLWMQNAPSTKALLEYNYEPFLTRYQQSVANWLSMRQKRTVDPQQILIAGGVRQLLLAILSVHTQPNQILLTEELGFLGIEATGLQRSLNIIPVSLDAEGLNCEALISACEKYRPTFLCCMSNLHNPTNITMTKKRRMEIAKIAETYDLLIIEDDVYGSCLGHEPSLPLLSQIMPERCFYVSNFSKLLSYAVPIGYAIAPIQLVDKIKVFIRDMNWLPTKLLMEMLSQWLSHGQMDQLVAWITQEMQSRQALAQRYLSPRWLSEKSFVGYHIWLPLPHYWSSTAFLEEALKRNIKLASAQYFSVGGQHHTQAIRISLSGAPDLTALEKALIEIVDMLEYPPLLREISHDTIVI